MTRKPKIVYLCGPRTGPHIINTNIELFDASSAGLRSVGLQVVNPVDVNLNFLGAPYSPPIRHREQEQTLPGLRADIIVLLSLCNSIALLPGWELAVGCRVEVALAMTFGYHFVHWQTGEIITRPPSVTIEHGYFDRPPLPSDAPPGIASFAKEFSKEIAERKLNPLNEGPHGR